MLMSLVALSMEKVLLKTSGDTFLAGVSFMYAADLSPDRITVQRTHSGMYVMMFHSKCDIRPFAANYASFDRVLQGIAHLSAWHLKSIEFIDIQFRSRDMPLLEKSIEQVGAELVMLRNCTYPGILHGEESQKLLSILNRNKKGVVCEYGNARLKLRLSPRPNPIPVIPGLGQQNYLDEAVVLMMAAAAGQRVPNHRARR
ncbi:unnamed protein product, partial [Mesorhabditis spiculigera]